MSAVPVEEIKPLRLDLGCGTRPKEGFSGVDSRAFDGVGVVCNLGADVWPWGNETVDEVHCSHMLEHLTATERVHFANELCRVLKKGAKATIITPHFASVRAYGDLTHQWPPVVSFWYLYLNAEWRKVNAPHNDQYTCDFDHGYGFGLHPTVQTRNVEYQNYAVVHLVEGAQDLHATLVKR
jgi:hypothetical protein